VKGKITAGSRLPAAQHSKEQTSVLKPARHKLTAVFTSQSHRESNQSCSGSPIWQHLPPDQFHADMAKMEEELKGDLKVLQLQGWFCSQSTGGSKNT